MVYFYIIARYNVQRKVLYMANKITFIDLFAGIGGFHLAFHNLGAECVMASEINKAARETYQHNFEKISPELFKNDLFKGDIMLIQPEDIPDFDIICGGFPCQPFSQIGLKKGFADERDNRGNMFFEILRLIKAKKPKAFFLENVRNLEKHDEGRTFAVIKNKLEELGYSFLYQIVRASDYGLPQHRPRLYMVGFRDEKTSESKFKFPPKRKLMYTISDVFKGHCDKDIGYTLRCGGKGSKYGDKRNYEFYMVDNEIKRIGIEEGKALQGFPDWFEFPVSKANAMKQLGNSVAVAAIQAVADNMIRYINGEDLITDEVDLFDVKPKK